MEVVVEVEVVVGPTVVVGATVVVGLRVVVDPTVVEVVVVIGGDPPGSDPHEAETKTTHRNIQRSFVILQ